MYIYETKCQLTQWHNCETAFLSGTPDDVPMSQTAAVSSQRLAGTTYSNSDMFALGISGSYRYSSRVCDTLQSGGMCSLPIPDVFTRRGNSS